MLRAIATDIATVWSVSLLVMIVSPTRMDEPIEMPFEGGRLVWAYGTV